MTGCYFEAYAKAVRSNKIRTGRRIKAALDYIERILKNPDAYVDEEKTETSIKLIEKFFFPLTPIQKMIMELVHCFYRSSDTVVFTEFDIMMGRGGGKNGFMSAIEWYLSTPYHGIENYNIDVIANNEEQARISPDDIRNMLNRNKSKMEGQFHWTAETIVNKKTGSYIRYNTSNARTKYGKRQGAIHVDEVEDFDNAEIINRFVSGLGKIKHGRVFKTFTQGKVRGAVLDETLERCDMVLNGELDKLKICPLLWELDDDKQAKNPANWIMANPNIDYFPFQRAEIERAYEASKVDLNDYIEFMTVRMNRPQISSDAEVTPYENIKAASKRPMIDLTGLPCVAGIDYADTTDFLSAGLLFFVDGMYFYRKKTWVCSSSKSLLKIRAPWQDWVAAGYLELVDDLQISPFLPAEWLALQMQQYRVMGVAIDRFRWMLLSDALTKTGVANKDTIKLTRGTDIIQVAPLIVSAFTSGNITLPDDPEMRWSINNSKRIASERDKALGNYTFGKIEPKSRKTDSFMAMVHAWTLSDLLTKGAGTAAMELPVFTF